ncbi:hypothetical protein FJ251_13400 [bacterium]|nr:hypothetical protein [bacterium]
MANYKSSGSKAHLAALALLALSSIARLCPGPALADGTGSLIIDIHDGQPWSPNYETGAHYASGNFMPGLDTWGSYFVVERLWFYHGGPYAESGVPYQVHFMVRDREQLPEHYYVEFYFDRTTTCNYCWEELVLGYPIIGYGPDDDTSDLGVFIRPFGGSVVNPAPLLWHDCCPNHDQLAATFWVSFPPPPEPTSGPQVRDMYELLYYYSDLGLGEVLLGMEVSSDVIVPTGSMSFSAVKSLY